MRVDDRLHAGPGEATGGRVLVVDDDEVSCMLVEAVLKAYGFEPVICMSGEAALRVVAEDPPDLVVLDARMPGLDGFETCRELRGMAGREHLPVLMMTGLDDDASIHRAFQAGATDFFVKTTRWELLAGRLRYMLRAARVQQEMLRSRQVLARAQELARMGSFEWRRPGPGRTLLAGLHVTEEVRRLFYYAIQSDEFSFRTLLRHMTFGDRHALLQAIRRSVRQEIVLRLDIPLADRRGHRVMHVECEPEYDDQGRCVIYTGVVQDVTERHTAEDRIRRLAYKDLLTELPNRRQFELRAEFAVRQALLLGHAMAVLLIDLDRFKKINDNLGHGAGDELLIEVADRLRTCVRHTDPIVDRPPERPGSRTHRTMECVARLGGDEFMALLPEVGGREDALRVAQRILAALREPVLVAGQELFATASIGVAVYPDDGRKLPDLMRNADVAMYAAKEQGRNLAIPYSASLSVRGLERLMLEAALHKALSRQEVVLHYQPKLDVRTQQLVGAEALMRWQREGGLVSPGDFIPLAEETGLIVALSEWALFEAAREAARWRKTFGYRHTIAVNLPSRMFARPDLPELVAEAAAQAGVAHQMLVLEITETSLMKDLQVILPTLHRLSAMGVQLSVDDFGTGYSSLHYLTELPLSELKIDRSFVVSMAYKPKALDVIQLVISLARTMQLRVVAEGVEDLGQLARLRSMGCDVVQGYLLGRPMAGGDMAGWVRNQWPDTLDAAPA